jgi:hypothetical protein
MSLPLTVSQYIGPVLESKQQIDLRVEVALGMPKHDCKFHGICKIDARNSMPSVTTGCRREDNLLRDGVMRIDLESARAALVIRIGQLAPELEQYHFGRERLRVWEPVAIQDYLPKGLEDDRYILPGAYQLIRGKTHYTVRLRLGQMDRSLNGLIWNQQ